VAEADDVTVAWRTVVIYYKLRHIVALEPNQNVKTKASKIKWHGTCSFDKKNMKHVCCLSMVPAKKTENSMSIRRADPSSVADAIRENCDISIVFLGHHFICHTRLREVRMLK
jgi:hypothetical protein